jgi:hypothetical protein
MNEAPIVPRSTTRALTDEGITPPTTEGLEPLNPPSPPSPSEQSVGVGEVGGEQQSVTAEEETLQSLLDAHDSTVEDTTPTNPTNPDFDTPEMKGFADQFKQYMGIDLKEAYESFTSMRDQYASIVEQYNSVKEQSAQQEYQRTMDAIKTDWGVNDAEFNRRAQAVLNYVAKLPEGLRQQVDNPEGIKLVWGQIAKREGTPTKNNVVVPQGQSNVSPQSFKKSELLVMMTKNPALYESMQAQIIAAYEAGRVIDDL